MITVLKPFIFVFSFSKNYFILSFNDLNYLHKTLLVIAKSSFDLLYLLLQQPIHFVESLIVDLIL